MSWLAKVSHIAGRAEDFLNKIDQNAAEVNTEFSIIYNLFIYFLCKGRRKAVENLKIR